MTLNNNTSKDDDLFTSKEELITEATTISEKAEDSLKQATFLYFLARFLVIYYEVNFSELPVQVWNEYRNALDHYFRSITGNTKKIVETNKKKMEGHLQRAVLDICKIICHKSEDRFVNSLKLENESALRLVDNGNFYTELRSRFDTAKDAFIDAKAWDLRLGENSNHDRKIVGKYLDAFYSYRSCEIFLQDNRTNIVRAEQQYKAIQHQSSKHHIRDSIIAKALWYGGVAVIAFLAGKFF